MIFFRKQNKFSTSTLLLLPSPALQGFGNYGLWDVIYEDIKMWGITCIAIICSWSQKHVQLQDTPFLTFDSRIHGKYCVGVFTFSGEIVEIDTDLQEHAQASDELLGLNGMWLYGDRWGISVVMTATDNGE